MLSLIEKAEQNFDQREAEKLQRKMLRNEFTLEDFLQQMQQVKRMGPIGQILDMVPGMGRLSKEVDLSQADEEFKKIEAIIRSMTPQERRNPKVLNASRKRRVAAGSGTAVQDVNALLKQFRQMQRLMQQIGKGRLPRIPGLPG
jgi:signal recognition particle subunit SRP54